MLKTKRITIGLLTILLSAFVSKNISATTYYVSTSGNDANNGTSTSSPWQTITKVNSMSFNPGDQILFNGGQTFTGSISPNSSGNSSSPITYSSYGTGRAIISDGPIEWSDLSYLTFSNLKFIRGGFFFYTGNSKPSHIMITDNEFSLGGGVLCQASYVTVQYNYFHESSGAPLVWCWDSNNITFQYNILVNIGTGGGDDGGAFDLDGGTTNSVIQYNYIRNVQTYAAMICDCPNGPVNNCAIRYNIAENCDINGDESIFRFITYGDNAGISNSQIYGNTAYMNISPGGAYTALAADNIGSSIISNCRIFNNIVYMQGNAGGFCGDAQVGATAWNKNCYYSTTGAASGSMIGGINANPLLTNPGNGDNLTDPRQLGALMTAYKLQAGSLCINAGVNPSAYGLNGGMYDFFSNTRIQGGTQDIGAYESGGTGGGAPATPVANAATNITSTGFSANWGASANATSYIIDISTVSTFATFVNGYSAKNVGDVTTLVITGLSANTDYFYRVRAKNVAGTSENSNVISLTNKPTGINDLNNGVGMKVYPTPATSLATLEYSLTSNANVIVKIFNINGQLVQSLKKASVVGVNKVELNLESLGTGMYFIKVSSAELNEVVKINVVK